MCLLTNQLKPKKAKKDITVYKVLLDINETFNLQYKTEYLKHCYIPGRLERTKLKILKGDISYYTAFDDIAHKSYIVINKYIPINKHILINKHTYEKSLRCNRTIAISKGFHAALSAERLRNTLKNNFDPPTDSIKKIFVFTIPKESKYYNDNTGLIVSNQIMMNSPVEIINPNKKH
jgi:translation initiation factor IF-1